MDGSAEGPWSLDETYLAVEEVLAKASPNPTYAALVAVIHVLLWVVIPQLADITVVPGGRNSARNAHLAGALSGPTEHT